MGDLRVLLAILPLVLVFGPMSQARWDLVVPAKVRLNLPLMLAAISALFPVKVAVVFLVAIPATLHVKTHLVTQAVLPLLHIRWALVVLVNLVMLVLIPAVLHVVPHLILHIILPLVHISRTLAVLVNLVMLTTSSPSRQS